MKENRAAALAAALLFIEDYNQAVRCICPSMTNPHRKAMITLTVLKISMSSDCLNSTTFKLPNGKPIFIKLIALAMIFV